jgi:hypothetical protein
MVRTSLNVGTLQSFPYLLYSRPVHPVNIYPQGGMGAEMLKKRPAKAVDRVTMTHWKRIRPRALAGTLFWAAAGFLLSTLLIYLFGDSGLGAYADLDAYRARLQANVTHLSSLNGQLASEARLAGEDPDTIRILARGIGLYAPEERVVRIRGYVSSPSAYEVGDLLRYRIGKGGNTRIFKILGICLPLALTLLSILLRLVVSRRTGTVP